MNKVKKGIKQMFLFSKNNCGRVIFSFALLLLFLFCGACSDSGQKEDLKKGDQAAEADGEDSANETEDRLSIPDNLPDIDFGGAKFRISTKRGTLYEIQAEEENGDILNDTLYARNLKIEERFNIEIVPVITEAGDGMTQVKNVQKSIQAGSDDFDLAATYVFSSGALVSNKLYHNWLDVEHIDFEKPWWINGINEKFRIGDAIYTSVGDMSVSTLKLTYAIFFNKRLVADYGMPDLYKTVADGEWTIDYFINLTRDIYSDLDGDGKATIDDLYGFSAESATNLDVYPFSFGIPILKQNGDGIPEIVINTPRMINAIEKVNELYWGGNGSHITVNSPEASYMMFKGGHSVFVTTWLDHALTTFRDMDDDYGILPYPKLDSTQERYMSGAMDNYSVLGIPVTAPDANMSGIITEALNAESYKLLYPVYYDIALKVKYARDEDSVAMLDIIMGNRNFDLCTLFTLELSDLTLICRNLVSKKQNDFASTYERIIDKSQKTLENIISVYTD